jgi:hypothetical protein
LDLSFCDGITAVGLVRVLMQIKCEEFTLSTSQIVDKTKLSKGLPQISRVKKLLTAPTVFTHTHQQWNLLVPQSVFRKSKFEIIK